MLWGLVSIHILGGACLFRRLLPRESPWLGFLVPSLAIPIVLNFIEHGVALPELVWLLPITFIGSVWMLISPKTHWRFLWKPAVVFLLAFTIPFLLRCLKPDIGEMRDGPLDEFLLSSFTMGDKLPPDSNWMPGFKLMYYYDFQHYAASVLLRLFDLDPGTGFNLGSALLSGFILFCAGGIAWRLGRQRLWIAILVVLMTATAMTGINDYLWFMEPHFKDPDDATMLLNQADVAFPNPVPFEHFIKRYHDYYSIHELIPPGYWSWTGGFHEVMGGHFLTLLSVMCLVEMVRRRRTNVPWIGMVGVIPLMLICSTWGVPMVLLFCVAGATWCHWHGIAPRNWRAVVMAVAVMVICLMPFLLDFLRVHTPTGFLDQDANTQFYEFLFQWWPFYIPWLALLFWWRKLNPAAQIVHVITPLMLIGMEFFNVGARIDMTGKTWGDIFGAAWAVFIPTMLGTRSYVLRGIAGLFVIACMISTCFWVDYIHRSMHPDDFWQLSGQGDMRTDPAKGRIFNFVSSVNHKIIIVGKSTWGFAENPLLANLTRNKAYIAWCFHCSSVFHPDSFDEASTRDQDVNAIYAGTKDDSRQFLHDHHIEMLVIWPEDHIPDDILAKLKRELVPQYLYQDCRGMKPASDAPNAGVFVARHSTGNSFSLPPIDTQMDGQPQ